MSTNTGPWPTAESAVAHILLGDWYGNLRRHYTSRILFALFILLLVALVGVFVLMNRQPQFRYVLTNSSGIILPMVPLEKANKDDQFVIDWTVDAMTRLYSFDFVNYRQQFQEAQKNLTVVGWKDFEKAMTESGQFESVIGNRFVATAVPTGPGRIIKQGDIMGRHAWKVEIPLLISYRSSVKDAQGRLKATNLPLRMIVTVIRQPEYINESGLGIRAQYAE